MPIKHAKCASLAFSGFVGGVIIGALTSSQCYQFLYPSHNCNYYDPNYRNDCDMDVASRQTLRSLFSCSSSLCYLLSPSVSGAEAQEQPFLSSRSSYSERKIPKDSKSRFLKYARRDEETGEYVQYLNDFIACMLLMEPLSQSDATLSHSNRYDADPKEKRNATQTLSDSAASLQQFPHIAQTRMKNFFTTVDLDHNGKINYAEFVMLFTMLSTRHSTLHRAFRLFDEHNNGRLNTPELALLLNTIMVDPAVQIRNAKRVGDRQGAQKSLISSSITPTGISSREANKQEGDVGQFGLQVDSPSGRTSVFPSSFSFGGIFSNRNEEAFKFLPSFPAGPSRSKNLSLNLPFSSVERIVFAPLSRHGLAPPGSAHHKPTSKEKNYLKGLEELVRMDAEKRLLSFDSFWYRVDFLRSELRAIEFGIFDPENTGFIHSDDFQKILTHQVEFRSMTSAKKTVSEMGNKLSTNPESSSSDAGNGPLPKVSWQLYQTIFEIMQESDAVSHALQLTLDAEPPALPSQLVAGAIPESKWGEVHDQIKQLTSELYTANAKHAKATLKKLVRPTGLTPSQFNQALRSCDDIPNITPEESEMLFHLFDVDHSGTITPLEFSRLCEAKQTFFAPYVPRFTESKRNKIQQFFHCMQQLE
ncbi:unnamed protein product [Phytomonas sp. EM1]|nr:unnamed protein product [Phytomonas sp. EM1]|eukprot:CCW61949.1 unnamed protein product [Phytomonas sp. isolate EM1]